MEGAVCFNIFFAFHHVQLALSRTHRVDYKTRWDRTEQQTKAFDAQMEYLIDAYLEWSYTMSAEENATPTGPIPADLSQYSIRVVDTLGGYKYLLALSLLSYSQLMKIQNLTCYQLTKLSLLLSFVMAVSHQARSHLQFASPSNASSFTT